MSLQFSVLIKNFIQTNVLDISKIETTLIEKSNLTSIEFCEKCIDLIIELNFTGPLNQEIDTNLTLPKSTLSEINEYLTCEGEVPYLKTKGIILLWIAKQITKKINISDNNPSIKFKSCILFLQCVYIHRATLREHISAQLNEEIEECIKIASNLLKNDDIDCVSDFQFTILASYLSFCYYNYKFASELLDKCKLLLGLKTEFSGAIGRRTKFQTTFLSQLYMSISREDVETGRIINSAIEQKSTRNLPNDQMIDDELLLDEIAFVDLAPIQRCTVAEQAVLLLQNEIHLRSHGRNEQVTEECDAIVFSAIATAKNRSSTWSLVTEALLYRSKFFDRSARKTEKSIVQLEELTIQYNHALPDADGRRHWFFLSRSPAVWELQSLYGESCLKLGMVKSALDILLQCDHWKLIIDCYTRLGKREKAVAAIKERLEVDGDTAELLCCLGDVTQERSHYEKAWTVSKERSARAMRSLAIHYMYVDLNLSKAAECFEKSLANNVMQLNTWFTYGCCCVQLKEYRKAVAAFKKCVTFESDNFEAWNNCASALTELGEHENALTHLREGIKYNYENWKLWDNLCIISAQVADYATTIFAYNRCIDLRQQHRDPASLSKIVKAIINKELDYKKVPAETHRNSLKTLFARINSVDGRDARLFMINAELLDNDEDKSKTMRERVVKCLSKSYHCMSQQPLWEKDNKSCKRVLMSAVRLAETALEYEVDLTSAIFAVKSVLRIVKNRQSDELEDLDEEVVNLLCEVEDLNDVMESRKK